MQNLGKVEVENDSDDIDLDDLENADLGMTQT